MMFGKTSAKRGPLARASVRPCARCSWHSAVRIGAVLGLAFAAGCDAISVAPSCPATLQVGQSGPVQANELNPGAIPTYRWEAVPADAGSFADAAAPTTTFTAAKAGEVVLRLTASDGLYQVVSKCRTTIEAASDVEVELTTTTTTPEVGFLVLLTCNSIGETPATTFSVTQTAGTAVDLAQVLVGSWLFTATQEGELEFECLGTSADGASSAPASLALTIIPPDDGTDNENDNGGGRR